MVDLHWGMGVDFHLGTTKVCLAKLIHIALLLEHCGRKTEILESHVPLDKAQKDDYHIERLGRLPKTTMWALEILREES